MAAVTRSHLYLFLVASALGAGFIFSCSTQPVRGLASGPPCAVPVNKGAPRFHRSDPGYSYCSQFVDSGCRLGDLGTAALGYFAPTGLDRFVAQPPGDLESYCPNYAKFEDETRRRFWIWVLMSVAYEEGGCGEPSVVQAVRNYYADHRNTKTASLAEADSTYALPYRDGDRKYRSEFCEDERIEADASFLEDVAPPGETGCGGNCLAPSKVAGLRAGTRCAMGMLSAQLTKVGKLVTPKSYWQKLTRPGSLTARLRKFGPCTDGA